MTKNEILSIIQSEFQGDVSLLIEVCYVGTYNWQQIADLAAALVKSVKDNVSEENYQSLIIDRI